MSEGQVLVIGVGNEYRGDDAAGLMVAGRLMQLRLPNVAVKLCPNGGLSLIDAWQGSESVIIVDAVRGAGVAGGIVRVNRQDLDRLAGIGTVSSHGYGIGGAVRIARALGGLPARLIIYGIEARYFEPGSAISPEVAAAIDRVVQLIAEELKCTSLAWPETLSAGQCGRPKGAAAHESWPCTSSWERKHMSTGRRWPLELTRPPRAL